MMRTLSRAIAILAVAVLFTSTGSQSKVGAQAYPVPTIDLQFSAMIGGPIDQFPQFPNPAYTDRVTIQAGQFVDIMSNTRFINHMGVRGVVNELPNANTVVRWFAPESSCPPSSQCLMWNYRTSNMAFPWWGVNINVAYVFNSAPWLSIDTAPNTPPGTYVIPITVEENPTTCGQFDNSPPCMGPVTKNFTIVVAAPPAPTADIKANGSDGPITVTPAANSVLLSWGSTNATSCTVTPGGWTGAPTGQQTTNVTQTTTYTLTCTGSGGTATDTVTVNYQATAPTATIFANGTRPQITIPYNTAANITWSSQNATSCTVSPTGWSGTSNSTGMSTGNLTSPRTYQLSCTGPGGNASDGVTVNVQGINPAVDIKLNGSDGPVTVNYLEPVIVSWTSQDAQSCEVSPIGATGLSGQRTDTDTYGDKTYTVLCYGAWGPNSISDTAQLRVRPPQPPTVDLNANPSSVPYNGQSTLTWTVANASSCTASGGWSGSKSAGGGSEGTGPLPVSRTYTLSCTGPGGSASDTATVSVGSAPPAVDIKANGSDGPITVPYNTAATISWTSVDATSCTVAPSGWSGTSGSQGSGSLAASRTYTASCTGPGGTATDSVTVNVGAAPSPTADIKANGSDGPISIAYNSAATVSWTSQNATSCSVAPSGWSGTSGSQTTGNLTAGRTYQLSCTGPGGTATDSVTINVGAQPPTIGLSPTSFTFTGVSGGATPPGQTLRVTNTGGGTLNWSAGPVPGKPGTWCSVSPASGSLASGAGQNVTVSVTAPSNVGTFTDCGIRISDPAATNNPQDASVTYVVTTGNPNGGPGGTITASNATCGQIDLSWTPGGGASGYNIYRNTVNSAPAAPLAANVSGLSYTDSSVAVGTRYYYWVESVGGSTKVPATTNGSGGIAATACGNPPGDPRTWNTSSDASVGCGTVKFTWAAPASGPAPTGYRVYRSNVGSPYSWQVAPSGANLPAGTLSYTDSAPLNPAAPNYYAVAALFGAQETAKVVGPSVQPTACEASLDSSDKDITGLNSSVFSVGSCNGFQAPPSSASFKVGDTVTFVINLCNTSVDEDAKNITITDTLLNLAQPSGGWQARFQNPTTSGWTSIAPTVSGTAPTEQLVFTFPSWFVVPKAPAAGNTTVRKFEFKAKIDVPVGFAGSFGRFQNTGLIGYDRSAGNRGSKLVQTALVPFTLGDDFPNRQESAP